MKPALYVWIALCSGGGRCASGRGTVSPRYEKRLRDAGVGETIDEIDSEFGNWLEVARLG